MAEQQAFPRFTDTHGNWHDGMTMRQYYKASALQGLIVNKRPLVDMSCGNHEFDRTAQETAHMCARLADAMLAEDAEHATRTTQQEGV